MKYALYLKQYDKFHDTMAQGKFLVTNCNDSHINFNFIFAQQKVRENLIEVICKVCVLTKMKFILELCVNLTY